MLTYAKVERDELLRKQEAELLSEERWDQLELQLGRYSLYLLCWYKSTNADAEVAGPFLATSASERLGRAGLMRR